jgi:membrane protein DedA with SNARE-associated domain
MRFVGMVVLASVIFKVERVISAGGCVALFGILFLCGIGLPLPEDIPLMIAGFMVGTDRMDLVPACIAGWAGIMGGDMILYHLGKRYGLNITRVPFVGKHVTLERIRKAELLFERYGSWVVAIGRLFAGVRGAMVIAAGAIRYNRVKFFVVDGLAAVVSGGFFIAVGYWVGDNLGSIEALERFRREKIKGVEHWVWIGVAVLVVGVIGYWWWRKRAKVPAGDVLLGKAVDHVVHNEERKHASQ